MAKSPKLYYSRDEVDLFVPPQPKLVLLGTMVAAKARVRQGYPKPETAFYYHDDRNNFWLIMQMIFENNPNPDFPKLSERKALLRKWGVAMANIVYQVRVPQEQLKSGLDGYIFDAQRTGNAKVKTIGDDPKGKRFKRLLRSKPTFFTRLTKPKPFRLLLEDYYQTNGLDPVLASQICHLRTPSRRTTPVPEIARQWRVEFKNRFLPV